MFYLELMVNAGNNGVQSGLGAPALIIVPVAVFIGHASA